MCGNFAQLLKERHPNKIFYASFRKTPFGYFYSLSEEKTENCSFKGNIFQITDHVKWLNARNGYLGAYFSQKSFMEKTTALAKLLVTFGWIKAIFRSFSPQLQKRSCQ